MNSTWRAFLYVMGANFQAIFLFIGASELSGLCQKEGGALCAWEPFFFPFVLVVSAFTYYKVLWFLVRSEQTKKKP